MARACRGAEVTETLTRYSRAVQLMLKPLPALPSMLRERRLCRVQLRHLTQQINQRQK
jgi:hypothetical protein